MAACPPIVRTFSNFPVRMPMIGRKPIRRRLSGFTTFQSGTPLSTRFTLFGVAAQFLNGRGDLGRTEMFTQTDFGLRHRYRFGNDGRFTLVANVDILNLFNEDNVLGVFEAFSPTGVTLNTLPGFPTDRDGGDDRLPDATK